MHPLILCIILLVAPILAPRLPAAEAAAGSNKASSVTPAGLLKIWKDYGLPLPPADAPFVRFQAGLSSSFLYLGFLLKPEKGNSPAVVLTGTTRFEFIPRNGSMQVADLSLDSLRDFDHVEMPYSNFYLATAMQCEARGKTDMAGALLGRYIKTELKTEIPPQDGLKLLQPVIWSCLYIEANSPRCNRTAVAARIRRLLNSGYIPPDRDTRLLLSALDAASKPGKGVPGTPEALIDKLADAAAWPFDSPENPRVQLIALGFAAVPALLDHLNDPRLCARRSPGHLDSMRFVGDEVTELLRGLTGSAVSRKGDRPRMDEAEARAWWKQVQETGEEKWLVKVLPANAARGKTEVNPTLLDILKIRYPHRLEEVLKTHMQEQPTASIELLLSAVESSSLPDAEKIRILKPLRMHPDYKTRLAVIFALRNCDRAYFDQEALKEINAMAAAAADIQLKADENRHSPSASTRLANYPEIKCAGLATGTADEAVWAALARAAGRAPAVFRVEMINAVIRPYSDEARMLRLHAFLGAFLDDTTKREKLNPRIFSGAGHFERQRVCDFAAVELGVMLGLRDLRLPSWGDSEWNAYRDRVKSALRNR